MNDKDIIQMYFDRDERALPATAKKYGKYWLFWGNGGYKIPPTPVFS